MADPAHLPSPAAAAELGRQLDRLLGDQLARIRRRYLVHGTAIALLVPALVVAFAFALDHFLRLPAPIRVFHTLAAAALLFWTVRRWVVYPLRRAFAVTDVALVLERAYPDLHQRLVSSIELKQALASAESAADARARDRALRNQSAAMIEQLLQDTGRAVAKLPLERLFDSTRTQRLWAGATLLLTLLLGGAIASPETAGAFLLRHLGRDVPYPRATILLVELPPAGAELQRQDHPGRVELVLPAGADLHVSVLATGVVPDEVFLDVTGGSGQSRSVAAAPRPGGRFRHVFRRVVSDFSFRARGGDDDRGDVLVTVRTIHPPLVTQIQAELQPPAYTRQPPSVQTGGAVEALLGTEVRLSVRATAGVSAAALVFLESGRRVPLQLQRAADDGAAEALVGEFAIDASDRYQVELTGEGGLRNPNPGTYPISALQDYAPVGRWLQPDDESSTTLLPDAILCVRGEAHDDFGLRSGRLVVDAGQERSVTRDLVPPAGDGAALAQRTLFLELLPLAELLGDARTADGLALQVEFTDNREPDANVTELPRRQVQIVDAAQLAALIARHFRQLREEVEQALDLQNDRKARLLDLLAEPPAAGPATAQVLTAIEVGQGRIESAAQRVLRGTMRAFDTHLWNKLDPSPNAAAVVELYVEWHRAHGEAVSYQPEFYRELHRRRRESTIGAMEQSLDPILQMVVLADLLAHEQSPPLLRLLAQAQVAATAADRERLLRAAGELQDRIAATLQDLLGRLDEWNDYQDLVQGVRSLRETQRDVQLRTEELRGRR
ncbi:MAG: hypothetical protein AB7O97_09085 [Planctomycetota bacterium]